MGKVLEVSGEGLKGFHLVMHFQVFRLGLITLKKAKIIMEYLEFASFALMSLILRNGEKILLCCNLVMVGMELLEA